MAKEKRDEKKREMYIERRREPSTFKKRKNGERAARTPKKRPEKKRSTATRSTATRVRKPPPAKDEFSGKLVSMKSELNALSFKSRNIQSSVNQLDENINGISTRVQNIRSNKYYSQKNLENMSKTLSETWKTISPSIESFGFEQANIVSQRQRDLESSLNRSNSLSELERLSYQLSTINHEVINIENLIQGRLDEYRKQYHVIDSELRLAEETISNLSNTSINWKNNEFPVLAVKIHDLTNDRHGVLTLSNNRILFEEVKEEVIRKNFLFTTEKKTTRDVVLDQPIGSVDEIEKGRVGFFKGAGLYLKFKPQTDLDELKIDTDGNDDDKIIRFYNYVISGEAEKEFEPIQDDIDKNNPVSCPNCSAPYGEEILKGQTSVKCIYCGTSIML